MGFELDRPQSLFDFTAKLDWLVWICFVNIFFCFTAASARLCIKTGLPNKCLQADAAAEVYLDFTASPLADRPRNQEETSKCCRCCCWWCWCHQWRVVSKPKTHTETPAQTNVSRSYFGRCCWWCWCHLNSHKDPCTNQCQQVRRWSNVFPWSETFSKLFFSNSDQPWNETFQDTVYNPMPK